MQNCCKNDKRLMLQKILQSGKINILITGNHLLLSGLLFISKVWLHIRALKF